LRQHKKDVESWQQHFLIIFAATISDKQAKCAAEVTKRAAMVADLKACAAAAAAAKAATRQAAQEERERVRADIEVSPTEGAVEEYCQSLLCVGSQAITRYRVCSSSGSIFT
jgi:hypothetical protein